MGVLLESVKSQRKLNQSVPKDFKREYVMDELKTLNVSVSRSGRPIAELSYAELKQELAIASVLNINIESQEKKFF